MMTIFLYMHCPFFRRFLRQIISKVERKLRVSRQPHHQPSQSSTDDSLPTRARRYVSCRIALLSHSGPLLPSGSRCTAILGAG